VTGTIELVRTIRIEARPDLVYSHFTDPARLATWWGEATVEARAGGALRVAMDRGPRPVMLGRYLALEPFRRIVFNFGWQATPGAPEIPPESTRVEVTLDEDAGATLLTLRHTGLPAGLGDETRAGWDDHLQRLDAVCGPGSA
jgi:uncharacterized protein YndB with AHSA1/START domain